MSLAVIPEDEAAQTDIDVKRLFFFFFCLLTRISPSHPHVSGGFPEGAGGGDGGEGLWGWWVPSSCGVGADCLAVPVWLVFRLLNTDRGEQGRLEEVI